MFPINPIELPNWNELLSNTAGASFFHTSNWARVLSETYNYVPLYFSEIQDNRLSTLIPLMEVKSLLTGKRGVSLPFTDNCPVISDDISSLKKKFDEITGYGKKKQWRYIEFRDQSIGRMEKQHSSSFYSHYLSLGPDEKIIAGFRDSTRRNIKKAEKQGVRVTISDSINSLKSFYNLNRITRKEHGLPPQPYEFFHNLHRHILSQKKGFVVSAAYKGRDIASAIFFYFMDNAIYKYGASDKNFQHLRANNLVMWEAIKWFCKNHFKGLDLGRTEPENKGLLQFKRGWGTIEGMIYYYKYDLKQDSFIEEDSKFRTSYPVFKKMPLPFLGLVGKLLYRHMG